MTRHLVLGALVGFGVAVLLLAAFGTGSGLVPLPEPPPDAGQRATIQAVKIQPQLPEMIANGLRRPANQRAPADAGTPETSR
ncbi:MAG: hypothetical protein ACYC8T_14320 [Myxococcaceae bacterium]